jgi:UTP-glucose-1-phosphate uridylyltransferase
VPVANKADPLLRHRGHSRLRHHRHRHRGGGHPGGDQGGRRRRLAFGVKVTYIHQEEPLGLAHAVLVSEPFLKDDTFVMFLGDNLIKDGITGLVEEFRREKPNSQILLAEVKNPQEFGVAELKGGQDRPAGGKAEGARSNLALVGVYMFDPTVFEAVHAIKPSKRNELEITDAIQYLIDKKYDVRRTSSRVVEGHRQARGHARGQPDHPLRPPQEDRGRAGAGHARGR